MASVFNLKQLSFFKILMNFIFLFLIKLPKFNYFWKAEKVMKTLHKILYILVLGNLWKSCFAMESLTSTLAASDLQALQKPVILRFADGELTTTFSTICRKDGKDCFFTPYANGTFRPKSVRQDIDLGVVPVIFMPDKSLKLFEPIFYALSLGVWREKDKKDSRIKAMIEALSYNDYWQEKKPIVFTGFSLKVNGVEFEFVDVKLASGKILQVGKYLVTQEQYQTIVGDNPSHFKNDLKRPVENFYVKDIPNFFSALNGKGFGHFRLPTELEYEELAIGGESNWWTNHSILDERVWHYENSYIKGNQRGTHPVGQKKPNGFGLYDILGHVSHLATLVSGDFIACGGSWLTVPQNLQPSFRFELALSGHHKYLGFRLIRDKD